MIDRAEVKKTFNVDLLDGNILPILVVAENRNSSASFIIVREKIFVFDATTGTTDATARKNVTAGKYATGQVLMALGGVATVMMGAKMSSDATVIEYGIADKMFYSRTIEPGQKAQGFLYFQLPKDFSYSTNYHVIAESKNTTTATVIPFDFDMNLHLNKL